MSNPYHRLSKGRYHVDLAESGSGRSLFDWIALHRCAADAVDDSQGFFIHLLDLDRRFSWSAGLQPSHILLTHAHADHIAGLDAVSAAFPQAKVLLHSAEHPFLEDPQLNLSAFIGMPISVRGADGALADGDRLRLGSTEWRVLHTPGHSPGLCVIVCDSEKLAITGDLLFRGSIGRTDLPGGDWPELRASLARVRLLPLFPPATASSRARELAGPAPDPAQVPEELWPLLRHHGLYGLAAPSAPP
jgi:glyoxylase-like metal-dependent hydrolase (beta-lactamase superfamily II)